MDLLRRAGVHVRWEAFLIPNLQLPGTILIHVVSVEPMEESGDVELEPSPTVRIITVFTLMMD